MKKSELRNNVEENMNTTKECLQTLFDSINKGQQKQILKKQEIKDMFDRYGVEY